MKSTIEKAINEQINAEFYSAYLYLSMAAYFDSINLPGFANWMKVQYDEEFFHTMKFYNYVYERGGKVTMNAVSCPPTKFTSPLNAFEETLKHEKHVTELIHKLFELALKEKDYAFQSFLKWYIDEQVEEENNAHTIIEKLKLVGDKGEGIYILDKELGTRTFVAPATEA